VPGIVGFARALELCLEEMAAECERLHALRDRLYQGLVAAIPGVQLNGPSLSSPEWRLAGNLNLSLPGIDGESLLLLVKDLALSSGSACTSAHPEPSHVLRALGLDDAIVRGSLRFGLGRFNTANEVEFAIIAIADAATQLQRMGAGI
jgi:cysteine desulfurase